MFFLCLLIFEIKSQNIVDCNNFPCDSCLFKLYHDRYSNDLITYPNILCVLKEDFDISFSFDKEDKSERIYIVFKEENNAKICFDTLRNADILCEDDRKILIQKLKNVEIKVIDYYDSLSETLKLFTLKYSNGFIFPVKLKRKIIE